MKKRIIKRFSAKALAAATGAAVMMSAYAPTLASAADEAPLYISEVYLSYGDTPDKAKQWLEDNDYTVLDQDLNEDAEGGVSWLGLGSEKRCVYLGYKTTTDESKAIRDMRAMNMNGDLSYDDYEKLLENKKSEISSFVSDMKNALAEYRANYEKGLTKAKLAHDKMNKYLDDDSGDKGLGDLLLKPIKEEMSEEDYAKASDDHADMTTLVMQGNIKAVSTLMTDLSLAADTAEDSWLTRLKKSGGIDGLYANFESNYSALSESKLSALMQSEYDDEAVLLAEKIAELREFLKAYTECPVKEGDDADKVDAYFKEHPEASRDEWIMAGTEYVILSETKFEDATLADLVTGDKYDFTDPDDRTVLYPIIDAMSAGQRALLTYIDLGEMIVTGNLDSAGWDQTAETTKPLLEKVTPGSVYAGIDRSAFKPGGIALTSQARKLQAATGSSYSSHLFGIDKTYIEVAGFVTSVIILGAGVLSLIHSSVLRTAAENTLAEARIPFDNLRNATDDVANRLYQFLTEKGINYIQDIDITSSAEVKNKVFNTLSMAAEDESLYFVFTLSVILFTYKDKSSNCCCRQ